MAKNKGFRDWYEESEPSEKFKKTDSKRYDKKRSDIQKARKQKASQKDSYFG